MKFVYAMAIAAAGLALTGCDDSTSKDPSTTSRDALNPPSGLVTVTWDKKIELRWEAANAEDELKGYHVFAYKGPIPAFNKATNYPKNLAVDLATGSIPRCLENSAIFVNFGFPAATGECEGDAEEGAGAGTGTGTGMMMSAKYIQEDGAAEDDGAADEAPMTNMIACAENTAFATNKLSLAAATKPVLGQQTCTVSQYWNGTALADMVNGETYTFFVVAVAGETNNQISWTSNFISDTPALATLGAADWVIEADKVYRVNAADLLAAVKAKTAMTADDVVDAGKCADFPGTPSGSAVCSINRTNNAATDGIYFGRLGSGSYPQRIFISTPANSTITMQLRGPQVIDPQDNAFSASIPGDQAAATVDLKGKLYPIYGNQVFDLLLTDGSDSYYGKVVIGQPTLADGAKPESDMTVPMYITMQPAKGVRHYMWDNDLGDL